MVLLKALLVLIYCKYNWESNIFFDWISRYQLFSLLGFQRLLEAIVKMVDGSNFAILRYHTVIHTYLAGHWRYMTSQNHRIPPTHEVVKKRPSGQTFDFSFCDLILLKYFSAQNLVGTEIEWNDVKANSVGIVVFWKRWINHPVSSIYKIPDFSFSTS